MFDCKNVCINLAGLQKCFSLFVHVNKVVQEQLNELQVSTIFKELTRSIYVVEKSQVGHDFTDFTKSNVVNKRPWKLMRCFKTFKNLGRRIGEEIVSGR